MSADPSTLCRFRGELATIVATRKSCLDNRAREDLFQALSALERRALIAGAPDRSLRDIAEARFLTGILRDAVRPSRRASLRSILRARRVPA